MFLKFVPNTIEEGEWRRGNHLVEVDEQLSYDIRYPLDYNALDKILVENESNSYHNWQVVWSLPGIESGPDWPEEGITLIKINYRVKNMIAAGFQNKTIYAHDCEVYIMSNTGQTVDKIR